MRLSALFFIIAVLAGAVAAGEPVYGGVLRWYEVSNPPHLDPHFCTDEVSARAAFCLFEPLVSPTHDGQGIQPVLAAAWSVSPDGMTWTFTLRKNVRFHAETEHGQKTANGGREVTSLDWKWSFERMVRDKSPRAYFLESIAGYQEFSDGLADEWAGISAPDRYTLVFTLKEPFAPFLSVLAFSSFAVLPREDVEKWGREFNFHPVGTGAFVFDEWRQDDRLILRRNPDYWRSDAEGRRLPYLDGWEMLVIPDRTVAWEEFKAGNLDVMRRIPEILVPVARERLGDKLLESPVPGIYYYGFNCAKGVFAGNKKLRQALNYAVNRDLINKVVMEGLAYTATGVLPPSMPGYNPELRGYEFNPEKAKQLLEVAGYKDGFEVTLQINNDITNKAVAEAVQAQVAELGITLHIRVVDFGVHLDSIDRGETEFFRMGWGVDYLDPDNFLYVNLHSRNFGPKGNMSFYKNEEADRLMDEGRVCVDPERRMELYREAERIIVDDAPWIFFWYPYNNLGVQKWVNGATLPAFGSPATPVETIWIDPEAAAAAKRR